MRKKIGILTGGGDCAGINSAIKSATYTAEELNYELFGIKEGWKGLIEPGKINEIPLNRDIVDGIGEKCGTIIGTSRTNPFKKGYDPRVVIDNLREYGYYALIAIGGEDTLGVAYRIHEMGVRIVGIPKTMDRDLQSESVGYNTATEKAKRMISEIRTTAKSHRRVFVIEVFGRHAGHVALRAGVAAEADVILIPEIPFDIDKVSKFVEERYRERAQRGDPYAIVVVAEGAQPVEKDRALFTQKQIEKDEFGHERLSLKKIGERVSEEIKKRLGVETRYVSPSHLIRCGESGCYDSFMGSKLGAAALYLVKERRFGMAVVDVRGDKIITMPLEDLIKFKSVDLSEIPLYERIGICFGRPLQPYSPRIEVESA
jgi:6-phosphofructokinase 1